MNNENVGSIEYDAVINTKGLKSSAEEADSIAKKTSSSIASNMKKAAVGLAVAGAGLTVYAKNATDFTVDLFKSSKALGKQIGVSTTEASRLTAAFSKMGLETESVQQMFGIFSKNIAKSTGSLKQDKQAHDKLVLSIKKTKLSIAETSDEIAKNGDKTGELNLKLKTLNNTLTTQNASLSKTRDAFDKLGVSTVDAKGKQKDFNTLLFEVSDKFKAMPDGINKTALSMELFGRSGKDMVKVLDLGSAGIKDLEDQADKLGLTLTAGTISKVNDFVQSQKDLKQQTDALKIAIGTATAPVLTAFNTKLTELVSAGLNAEGVLQGVTVSILAFGGPVATASAGVLAFAANIVEVVSAAGGLRGALGLLGAFLAGPWGIAIVATGLAIGALTLGYKGQRSAIEELRVAQDLTKVSQDNLRSAQLDSKQAAVNLEGATLRVKDAQKAHTEAVRLYGPKSLEAREANNRLKDAILAKKRAEDASKESLDKMKEAESDYAKNKDMENALRRKADQVKGLQGALNALNKDLEAESRTSPEKPQSGQMNLISRLQSAFSGGRARGGPVSKGKAYVVGEEGPELFTPNSSGKIIPNDDLGKSNSSISNSKVEVNINMQGIMSRSKSDERDIARSLVRRLNEELSAKGMQPIGGGI